MANSRSGALKSIRKKDPRDSEMPDLIDSLIADWAEERPDLDASPMDVAGRLLRVNRKLDARLEEILKPYGLRYSEFDVIATLLRSGQPYELTPTALQNTVVLTSGAMTALLDRLTRQGLIKRNQCDRDGRSKTAQLTKKGVDLANTLIKLRFDEAKLVVSCLTKSEKSAASSLLKGMEQWLHQLET